MAVLIPFTGGIESTYLVQEALKTRDSVILAYYAVTQSYYTKFAELVARRHIINYWKRKYPHKIIRECYGFDQATVPLPDDQVLNSNGIRQQINLVRNVVSTIATFNTKLSVVDNVMLGWTFYDTADVSYHNFDFTKDEYQRLAALVPEILFLGNYDKSQKMVHLPLWNELNKGDVYRRLDPDLQEMVVANGQGELFKDDMIVSVTPDNGKLEEYRANGIMPNIHFPMVEFNLLEQALLESLLDDPTRAMSMVPDQYSGYTKYLHDVQPEYHLLAKLIIRDIVLASVDEVYYSDEIQDLREAILKRMAMLPQIAKADADKTEEKPAEAAV